MRQHHPRMQIAIITLFLIIFGAQLDCNQSLAIESKSPASENQQSTKEKSQLYVDVSTLADSNVKNGSNTGPKFRHNLPECATQQVCNALFVKINVTQHLCECSSNYNWECSSDPNAGDGHTIELTRRYDKKVYTQVKLCEPLVSVRACKAPTDWTLLALQSERNGKAHYVSVCKCPDTATLEGPYTHSHPPYARIPGIRVYGMLCAQGARKGKQNDKEDKSKGGIKDDNKDRESIYPEIPWHHVYAVLNATAYHGVW